MNKSPLRLAVIVGSVRPGRFGPTVAQWFAGQVRQREDIELDYIDLADAQLPVGEADFVCRVDRADAFVIVTPEYNHGYPGPLKTAIDLGYDEWNAKPIAFVSYGGMAGGQRAVEQLRQVFAELHAVTVRDTVSFHMVNHQFTQDGEPRDAGAVNAAAKVMLDRLSWWAAALRTARAAAPYGR